MLLYAFALGLTPFLAGDAIKAAIAAMLLPGAWKLAGGVEAGRPALKRAARRRESTT
ncbi:MAG: hypothetical protein ACLPN6_09430 [Streptosporangiaceae bacterium]|jgi:biotin transport system substrate-specific component